MNIKEICDDIKNDLDGRIHFLEDKPEEDMDSTIRALWLAASGVCTSCEKARDHELPSLSDPQEITLRKYIEQRLNNVPLAHLTKRQCFMGIELLSDNRALIPRKETEMLGNKALQISKEITKTQPEALVIDACCGSGNLAVAIAKLNPLARVFAADLSDDAVELAKENVKHLELDGKVQVEQGDFLSAFESEAFYESVDLIMCNPPYISSFKVPQMNAEISSNEPALAFDGGMMGFEIIQKIISQSPRFLKKRGWAVFEVGLGQGPFVVQLLERSADYSVIEPVCDTSGEIRVIAAQKNRNSER